MPVLKRGDFESMLAYIRNPSIETEEVWHDEEWRRPEIEIQLCGEIWNVPAVQSIFYLLPERVTPQKVIIDAVFSYTKKTTQKTRLENKLVRYNRWLEEYLQDQYDTQTLRAEMKAGMLDE